MGIKRLTYGTHSETEYISQAIPSRGSLPSQDYEPPQKQRYFSDPAYESFVEINLSSEQSDLHVFGRPAQPLENTYDEARALFCEMKQIARQGYWRNKSKAEIFFEQAEFMSLFSDDYASIAPFKQRYPQYQKMTYEQLRTYFTWRNAARKGLIDTISVSYAYVYAYELINHIGVENPQEGLDKLVELWRVFCKQDPSINKHLLSWIKDYHVFYPVQESFQSFALRHRLHHHYPTVFCFDSNENASFGAFAQMSSYNIKESIFYPEAPKELIQGCFCFVLNRLREVFSQKNERLEDYILFSTERKVCWVPFKKALFFPTCTQEDRVVQISAHEEYECRDNSWTGSVVIPDDSGKQLIGYIMKEVEVFARNVEKFRYKLTARIDSFKNIDQTTFLQKRISIPLIVKQACADFYKQYTWKTVSVDLSNLRQIREDAFDTQGKLLIPDESNSMISESNLLPTMPSATRSSTISGEDDIWSRLRISLAQIELEALVLILSKKSLASFARERNVMLEVLVDSINEKAMDHLGDTLIEIDDTVTIYDEYQEDLKRMVNP